MPTELRAVLSRRPGCVVTLDGDLVRKTFTGGDHEAQLRLAARESERLHAFRAALEHVDGATCPEVLRLVPGPPPEVRMARAPGEPLLRVLAGRTLAAAVLAALADVAAAALRCYVDTFGEPYEDFQFDNMLYDEASGTLTFLDFDLPEELRRPATHLRPVDATVGNLVGSTVFQSARPTWLRRRRQHRQATTLCVLIVDRLVADGSVEVDGIIGAARAAYLRSAAAGPWFRQVWYAVIAPAVARQVRLGGDERFRARPFWPRSRA